MIAMGNMNFGRPQQIGRPDPEQYAKIYASENGLSVDEARTQLREQFGDPQAMDSSIFNMSGYGPNNATCPEFTEEDMAELQNLHSLVFGKQGENNGFSLINPETNTVTGPQKEGDPVGNLFSSISSLFGQQNSNNTETMQENAPAQTLDDIKGVLGADGFNNFMMDNGFNDKTSEKEVVEYFNQMNK